MRDTWARRFVLVLSCHGHCHSQSRQTGPQLETWQRARRYGPLLDDTQVACDVVLCVSAIYLTAIVCFAACCPREKQITARSTYSMWSTKRKWRVMLCGVSSGPSRASPSIMRRSASKRSNLELQQTSLYCKSKVSSRIWSTQSRRSYHVFMHICPCAFAE